MIDFYTWSTPNGYKIAIMLEESAIDYQVKPINIRAGEQHSPEFLSISPNNKIPAIVDDEGDTEPVTVFESAAILTYLADKTGSFLPQDMAARAETLSWLAWQISGVGPSLGQLLHFTAEGRDVDNPYAAQRFSEEAARLYGVLDKRLGDRRYVAGDYSIADMALFPWIRLMRDRSVSFLDGSDWIHIERWLDDINERAAVGRAYQILG